MAYNTVNTVTYALHTGTYGLFNLQQNTVTSTLYTVTIVLYMCTLYRDVSH